MARDDLLEGYESFNGGLSRKIEVGELGVPFREIPLTTGHVQRIYDTSGPQGADPHRGLPRRRGTRARSLPRSGEKRRPQRSTGNALPRVCHRAGGETPDELR